MSLFPVTVAHIVWKIFTLLGLSQRHLDAKTQLGGVLKPHLCYWKTTCSTAQLTTIKRDKSLLFSLFSISDMHPRILIMAMSLSIKVGPLYDPPTICHLCSDAWHHEPKYFIVFPRCMGGTCPAATDTVDSKCIWYDSIFKWLKMKENLDLGQ